MSHNRYGTGEMLGWLVEREIGPHIPVWERSKVAPEGKLTRADFIYDDERDVYVCPNRKELRTSGTVHDGATFKYFARKSDCTRCPLKPNCTTGSARRLGRDVNEAARDHVRSLMGTEAYRRSARERKKIETRFGVLYGFLGLRQSIQVEAFNFACASGQNPAAACQVSCFNADGIFGRHNYLTLPASSRQIGEPAPRWIR